MLNEGGDGHAHGHGRGQNVGVGLVNVSDHANDHGDGYDRGCVQDHDHACAHVPGLWQKLFALPLARFRTIASGPPARLVLQLPEQSARSLHGLLPLARSHRVQARIVSYRFQIAKRLCP